MHTCNKKTHFKFAERSGVIEEQHEIVVTTLREKASKVFAGRVALLVVYRLNNVFQITLFCCLFRGRKIFKRRRYICLPHHMDNNPSYTAYPRATTNFCNGTATGSRSTSARHF